MTSSTRATDRDLPVPSALNVLLVALTVSALCALLAAARVVAGGWAWAGVVVAYALAFQTCFALFHEAGHRKLHRSSTWNGALGAVLGCFFGMSITMFSLTHWTHHLKNRADEEAYDQVAPHESYVVKAVGWYGMLLSLWYWVIPLMNVLIIVSPGAAGAIARRARIADRVFRAPPATVRAIRLELLVWLAVVVAVAVAVGWRALALQAAGAWLWSTINYVEHAYAPRDVLRGAFNLRAPLFTWINLHREHDLTHHVWPDASWIHLPRLTRASGAAAGDAGNGGSLWVHWLAQWRGPVRAAARGPAPVDDIPRTTLP